LPFPVVSHCRNRLATLDSARHGRKSRTCRWNFDAICCSSSCITISGFGGHIAISGCLSMLQSLVDTFCELAVVENPRFALGIVMISVGDISTSGLDGQIVIFSCPSMSLLFVDTFFEFDVVENFVFRARIRPTVIGPTYFRFIRLYESVYSVTTTMCCK